MDLSVSMILILASYLVDATIEVLKGIPFFGGNGF